MLDQGILAYYEGIALKILPFLQGRFVAIRHHFPDGVVFRRHRQEEKRKSWITINTKTELLAIVHQHGYEFFPHLEGERDYWFALDIDLRAVPLALGKLVVRETLVILDERGVQYLLTYSGSHGFHIRWSFPRNKLPRDPWLFLRTIVRRLQAETEKRLQRSVHREAFAAHIPAADPITELNAMDKRAQRSVLFDELILKPLATIRAPFSLHMEKRLVAVPIDPARLSNFLPERDATPDAARGMTTPRLPRNPVARFLVPPWC